MIEILFEQSGDPLRAAALNDSEDVLCLPFLLDTGALQGGIGSPDRAAVLAMSLGQNGQSSDPKADLLAPLLTELKRLETYLGQGASVRIWYSNAPYSLCGLYHLCSILLSFIQHFIMTTIAQVVSRRMRSDITRKINKDNIKIVF